MMQLPQELRDDIAAAVRAVNVTQIGGTCGVRAAIGHAVLRKIGLPAEMVFGSVLYRAGPDSFRDVMAYRDHDNLGRLHEWGMQGHVWLEWDGDLIDFSVGNWVKEAEILQMADPQYDPRTGALLEGIQWDVVPPDYLWRPAAGLKRAWRAWGVPGVSEYWYGGWEGVRPVCEASGWVLGRVIDIVEELGLERRVAEWRRGVG